MKRLWLRPRVPNWVCGRETGKGEYLQFKGLQVQRYPYQDTSPVDPAYSKLAPKGGRVYLMSSSCLESKGCPLIPLFYLLFKLASKGSRVYLMSSSCLES